MTSTNLETIISRRNLKVLFLAFVVYLCYLYWIEALHPSLVDLFFKSRDDQEQLISDEEEQTLE